MIETLKRFARRNRIPIYVGLVTIVFLSNIIPFHLQADDEKDVFESTHESGFTSDAIDNETDDLNDDESIIEETNLDYEIYFEDVEVNEIIIYLRQEFIDGISWLFSYPNEDAPMARIGEEEVWILEESGNWLKVLRADQETKGWMNANIYPCTAHLDELLSQWEWGMSVHFENMETGFVYQFNEEHIYPSASVKKAVHGLYIYKQAEQGYIDLDATLWGVANPNYSIREFVSRNIRVSDDHATFVLLDKFGLMGYLDFVEELGANRNYIGPWIINSQLTVGEASIFARAIFEYMESDGIYNEEFRDHMLNNEYPFIVSDYPVASKTGWYPPFAWHDLAIVYAPSPYALIILSARHGWSDQDYEDFRIISMAFQEFNRMWFSE